MKKILLACLLPAATFATSVAFGAPTAQRSCSPVHLDQPGDVKLAYCHWQPKGDAGNELKVYLKQDAPDFVKHGKQATVLFKCGFKAGTQVQIYGLTPHKNFAELEGYSFNENKTAFDAAAKYKVSDGEDHGNLLIYASPLPSPSTPMNCLVAWKPYSG